jgi:hypothetical protein
MRYLFVILFLFISCDKQTMPLSEEHKVVISVLKYQMVKYIHWEKYGAKVFYAQIFGKNPSAEIQNDSIYIKLHLKSVSESIYDSAKCRTVDAKSKLFGLIIIIDSLKFLNDTAADVFGGYYMDCKASSVNQYKLIKIKSIWEIIKDIELEVS